MTFYSALWRMRNPRRSLAKGHRPNDGKSAQTIPARCSALYCISNWLDYRPSVMVVFARQKCWFSKALSIARICLTSPARNWRFAICSESNRLN
jgi:hypothetical protein